MSRVHFYLLILLFGVAQAVLFFKFGIVENVDSQRYLDWALQPLSDISPTSWKFYSFSYLLILSFFIKSGLGIAGLVLFQISASLIACLLLYQLAINISGSKKTGLLAASLFILFGEIMLWNTYVLTESLFTSGIVWVMYLISMAKSKKNWIICSIVVVFVALIRPMGITVILAFLLYLSIRFRPLATFSRQSKWAVVMGMLILAGVLITVLLEGNPSVNFYYSRGQIVWGTDSYLPNKWLRIDNSGVSYPPADQSSIGMFATFVANNPTFFLELTFRKAIMFLLHIKPYHSIVHQLGTGILLIISYLLSLSGFFSEKSHLKYFVLGLFLTNWILVSLSVEAYDGRFLVPLLPGLMLLASAKCQRILWKEPESPEALSGLVNLGSLSVCWHLDHRTRFRSSS